MRPAVGGVALGDAAEVDLHARLGEADGALLPVDLDPFVADLGHRFVDGGPVGRAALVLAEESPEAHERPGGDIEGPARERGVVLRLEDKPEYFWIG